MSESDLLLPVIRDRAHYTVLFKDNTHWGKAIAAIVEKHGLRGDVQRGVLGSHIVYRVGDCWVKLMAPMFAKDMQFEVSGLKAVEGRLSVATPKILGEGVLEGWPYIIIGHISGSSIRHVWKDFTSSQKLALAAQMAQITKEIRLCPVVDIVRERFEWNEFIAEQFNNFEAQQVKKSLPAGWLRGLGAFLGSFSVSEFQTSAPAFIHADLTFDHFLVSGGDAPQITGVIDLADCQVGHFEYELVAPCTFVFKGDAAALRAYLLDCGYTDSELNSRFSEKLLAWSVLHRYFSLVTWFAAEMEELEEGDFARLAKRVFPLHG